MLRDKGKKGGQHVAAAGVAGAIVGASVGAATAWALRDEKNRKKLEQTAKNVSGFVQDKMKDARHSIHEHRQTMDKAADVAEGKIKETEEIVADETEKIN